MFQIACQGTQIPYLLGRHAIGSKYLRWIMLECLHAHIRSEKNSNVTQFYHRISKNGNSKAAVAACFQVGKDCLLDYEGKTHV